MESATHHVTATYCRPATVDHVHPDLDFLAHADSIGPFVKPSSSVAGRRKPKQADSDPASFYDSPQIHNLRNVFRQWTRPPPTGNEELMELFVVDVVDPICPTEQTPSWFRQRAGIALKQSVPIIEVFGITLNEGASVALRIWGFFPYLLAECPIGYETNPNCCKRLKDYLEGSLSSNRDALTKVLNVELVDGEGLMEYSPNRPKKFFKIAMSNPRLVASVRSAIENGITLDGFNIPTQPYEAHINYTLRWMIDMGVVGCGCIRVPWCATTPVNPQHRVTRCQREVDVFWSDVSSIECVGEYAAVPRNLRVLALDIECVTVASAGFPVPDKDPVIQISSILTTPGRVQPIAKIIFTLDTCASIAGSTVLSFQDERSMLSAWRELVIFADPDILTGYNFINFDLNYLVLRSHTLDVPNFRNLGRLINVETRIRDATLSTRALGTHENKDINIEGRVQFDALEMVRRDYKLKSYSLNAVSSHFLKETKEDVHYSQIGDLQRGNAETRKRIAVYCLKDSWLVVRIIEALCFLINYIEMARVTGVPMSYLLTRGQAIKVMSQLVRKCREMKYFVPSLRTQGGGDGRDVAYEGATVLDPMKDYYDIPIATLDFASLYPSIMIAHNLCYTTLVPDNEIASRGLKEEDVYRTPAHKTFVKQSVKRGILPTVLADLLAARKKAKKEMAQATDPLLKMVLDGRQLALKISANSVYGFTGAAATGQLPCLAVSESITAYGRSMIDFTKNQVEERFRVENGYDNDAVVVYGDTDSVMVKFGTADVAETMALGREAATFVSGKFLPPIALEFEKVYFPFLLMNKKRYAGLMWSKPDKYAKIDCKGIETVRRDFCLLVQTMVDEALKALLVRRDVAGARTMTKTRIQDLLMNKIDMSYLVLSKSLGKEDYSAKLAHVELAKKLRKRDPGTAPQIGDRVYYVIVAGAKGQAQYERAEDPLYALENNIPIDVDFYLDSIKNPLQRIFEPIEKGNIDSLFSGEHTRQKKVVTSTTGALSKFVTAGLRCLGCRGVIKEGAFCKHCENDKERHVTLQRMTEFRAQEREFHQLWVQCQRCQESLHQDVICTSRDCPIFYRRTKIKKEVNDQVKTSISRLTLDDW